MQKKTTPNIVVAIPAYNEAENIKNLLKSVLRQTGHFKLSQILVISDGSQDETVAQAKSIDDKRLKVLDHKVRKGKSFWLNEIFSSFKGDVLVLFDADVVLAHPKVIENLIKPIITNSQIGLVGGNPQPIKAKTYVEQAVNLTTIAYDNFRKTFQGGHNAFGCDGRILALSPKFLKTVKVPHDMIANDAYMYFCCVTSRFKFNHVRNAQVWYRSPITLRDQIRQNSRFLAARQRLHKIFGEVVPNSYSVPSNLKYQLFFKVFIQDPSKAIFIFLVNKFCAWNGNKAEIKMNALWDMAITTKSNIRKYAK